jgi:hypothetical protein
METKPFILGPYGTKLLAEKLRVLLIETANDPNFSGKDLDIANLEAIAKKRCAAVEKRAAKVADAQTPSTEKETSHA